MSRKMYLAGFKGTSYPTVPMHTDTALATVAGTIDDVAKAHPEMIPVLYNDVKACKGCGKPCAYTMTMCNSCGMSLADVPITKSENVFCAFLMGVAKANKGFPLKISLRRLTEDVLIIDDLLALTPCHFNAIPKKHYIPDWRFLLTSPKQALELLDTMEAELWVATKQFLNSEGYRGILKPGHSDEDIRKHVICSFNFPPSQFQLHIQWIVAPLTPFQHFMAEERNHFHEDRAFPMSYVRKILALSEPYNVKRDTPIEEIVKHFDQKGVVYKDEWNKFYQQSLKSTMELQNWSTDDFQYVVQDGKVHDFEVSNGQVQLKDFFADLDPKVIQDKDKVALQNYGRPYVDGKPTGTYIKAPLMAKLGEPGGFGAWPGVDLK